jgi:hypothetical protein
MAPALRSPQARRCGVRSPQARRCGGGPASGEGQRRCSGRCGASAKRKRPPQRDADGDEGGEMDRAVGRYLLYAGGMRALKPPFVCCWFDSCLRLQVRGGRSEHLRCQHSHPPTGAAVGYGSERAYPMAGGEWHPAAPSINRTIYRCLLQGFENCLNLQSRESGQMEQRLTKGEQPQHAHVWRGCSTRAQQLSTTGTARRTS